MAAHSPAPLPPSFKGNRQSKPKFLNSTSLPSNPPLIVSLPYHHRQRKALRISASVSFSNPEVRTGPGDLVASILSKVIQTDRGVLLKKEEHKEVAAVAEELQKYCVNEPVKCPLIFGVAKSFYRVDMGPGSLSLAFPPLSAPPMAISSFASLHTKGSNLLPAAGAGQCKYTGQSVRALPIRILTVGKKRSRGVQLVVDEYIGKLKNYCIVYDVQIRSNPRNARNARAQVDDEDAAVMNLIKSDDWVVMLDENGQDIGSEQMAELVGDAGNTGASRLSFCIGGPYGHG